MREPSGDKPDRFHRFHRLARRYSRRDRARSAESQGRCEELTRVVACACRSRTNASEVWLSSPGTRLEATETNATKRPPELSGPDPVELGPFAGPPRVATLATSRLPDTRLSTTTCCSPPCFPPSNATVRPSAEIAGLPTEVATSLVVRWERSRTYSAGADRGGVIVATTRKAT